MTKTTYALIASANGIPIISNKGIRYNPEELNAKAIGEHAVVFNSGILSKDELKGDWVVMMPRKCGGAKWHRSLYYAMKGLTTN